MPKLPEPDGLPLRVPQLRVLKVLASGALLTRAKIKERAGFTEASGCINRALRGIRVGSNSGPPHRGLLALGLVESVELDLDGEKEIAYRITNAGREALAADPRKDALPQKRSEAASTNKRYLVE